MEKKTLTDVLTESGLPHKAAMIYVALLGSKGMSVSEIARATNLKRATCYEYLDTLLGQELLIRIPDGKRMQYAASDPKKTLARVKRSAEQLERAMPDLLQLHDKAFNKPRVSFFEGKKELRGIYDDMFSTVGEVRSIFPPAAFFEHFSEEDYDDFDKKMTDHAIVSKDLFIKDASYKRIRDIRKKNGGNKVEKMLPSWFTSNIDVLIYREKVALISLRDLSAIIIENKDIADLFRNLHTSLWKDS